MAQEHILLGQANGDDVIAESERQRWDKVSNNFNNIFESKPDKLGVFFLTQTSTNNPVATVLINTIGPISFLRTDVGTYTVTKEGAFTIGKTTPNSAGVQTTDIVGNKITAEQTSVNVITIKTYGVADTEVLADDCLTNQEFQIKIYQ